MLRIEHVVDVRKGRLFLVGRVSPMNYKHEGKRLVAVVFQDFTERWNAESLLQASYQMRRKSDFLNDLVLGNRNLDTDALDVAAKMGLDFSQPMFCCIVSSGSLSVRDSAGKSVFSELSAHKDMIMTDIGNEEDRIVWDCREGIGVIFLQRESPTDGIRQSIEKAAMLKETICLGEPDLEVVIGVGDTARGADGLRKSFRQARNAILAIRSRAGNCDSVSHFRKLGILQLLAQTGGDESSREFVDVTLGALIAYDREKGTDYLQTLELILASVSLKEVAQALFIHPNTVLFRRQRIEKLLCIDLDDFETRIALVAAIKLHKLDN
jgi:sugar diacid utilization regulator